MSDTNIIASQGQEDIPEAPKANDSWWISMVPMVLIFVVFYFLLIRPQEKKRRDHEKMVSSVKKGESIITSSGIYGKVVKINDSEATAEIEISKGITIKILKSTIATIILSQK